MGALTKTLLSVLLVGVSVVRGAKYGLAKDYSGASFFQDWDFYDHCAFSFSFLVLVRSLMGVFCS